MRLTKKTYPTEIGGAEYEEVRKIEHPEGRCFWLKNSISFIPIDIVVSIISAASAGAECNLKGECNFELRKRS